MEHRKLYLGLGLVAGLAMAGQAAALVFVIDDFNAPDPIAVSDNTADDVAGIQGSGNQVGAPPAGQNAVWQWADSIGGPLDIAENAQGNAGNRDIYAELDFADGHVVETQVCHLCNAGHFSSDAPATGNGSWIYTGGPEDVSAMNTLVFHYAADLDGYSMDITFDWDNQTQSQTVNYLLYDTGGPNITDPAQRALFSAPLSDWDQADFADLTSARFDVLGVQDLDFSIDSIHLAAVPEPTTLALMGLGLAGLGWRGRRKA